ncbi:MAG: DUF2905 family protein [Bacteroidia bacterium]
MLTAGKWLIGLGVALIIIGTLLWFLGSRGMRWPQLPLDFVIDFPGGRLYLPIGTSILLSLILSFLLYAIRRYLGSG